MQTHTATHPSAERLIAFDLGHLPREEWTDVERHVAICELCCRQLQRLPDDDLVRLIKSAVPRNGDPPRRRAESRDRTPAGIDVPPELRDHPRYRILALLGSGGMGVVFKAEHQLMERIVALKVMNARLLAQRSAVERFRLEVKAAARLSHPNIVTAYDADQADGLHFLVMEFVEGVRLDHLLLVRGPLPVGHACDLVRQAALGLQHAFERGMTHRDIKPGNLLLTPAGQVKVLDFGLARFLSEEGPNDPLTPSGYLIGTPDYIAPEQAQDSRRADIRADIYSLGCTFYQLLSGTAPFAGGTVLQKLLAHRERSPQPLAPQRTDLPPGLSAIVERMMAKAPAERFATPGEIAAALAPFVQTANAADLEVVGAVLESRASQLPTLYQPRTKRTKLAPGGAIAAAVVLAVVGGLAAWFVTRPGPPVVAGTTLRSETPLAPVATLPVVTPPATVPEKRSVRDQTVAWLQAQNSYGSNSKEATSMVRDLDRALNGGQSFYYRLGSGLVRSKRPTLLVGRCGTFHVFEITDAQKHQFPLDPYGCDVAGLADEGTPLAEPLIRLSDLKIDNAARLDGNQPLTGSVKYEHLKPVSGPLVYRQTRIRTDRQHTLPLGYRGGLPAEKGSLSLVSDPVNLKDEHWSGLMMVFVEVCLNDDKEKKNRLTVISNTLAAVVVVETPP